MSITDDDMFAALPNIAIDRDNKEFYRGWLDRRLVISKCGDCGTWHHPPRPICPSCWSFNIVPTAVSGEGAVYMVSRHHKVPSTPGVDPSRPHPVVTVELAEQDGLRFTSTMANGSSTEIGAPVRLAWVERHGAPYPVFEPMPGRR